MEPLNPHLLDAIGSLLKSPLYQQLQNLPSAPENPLESGQPPHLPSAPEHPLESEQLPHLPSAPEKSLESGVADSTISVNSVIDRNSVINTHDIPSPKKRGRPPKNSPKSPPPQKKRVEFLKTETTFSTLATDVVHRLGKPHEIPHHILLHLHLHMKENMLKLIKHTEEELIETINNFLNNSKLLMASIAHNYSNVEKYPCLGSSSSSDHKELFEFVKKFENDTPSTPTP